ncbi:MAG: helix-turn-helix domain-containing protein [Bacteroidota bacterium]
MNTFSDELRKERVAKDISLADISKKTHINVKYLEAIEQGSFDILPQTYIRAFIREYALVIGLAPKAVLKKFDVMVGGKYSVDNGSMIGSGWSGKPLPSMPEQSSAGPPPGKPEYLKQNDNRTVAVIAGVVVVAIVLIYFVYNYATQETITQVAQETPFQDVVKEQEKQITPQKAALDTLAVLQAEPKRDSLILRAVTVDSVWISIGKDEAPSQNTILPPEASRTWIASKQFRLSLGNAGGIRFMLNGKDIGRFGKRGAVVRNIILTPDYLKSKR